MTLTPYAFWRVHALVCVGRHHQARELMEQMDAAFSPLGLMSEMSVPGTGDPIGNLPQALSHLTHIRAAAALRAAEKQ